MVGSANPEHLGLTGTVRGHQGENAENPAGTLTLHMPGVNGKGMTVLHVRLADVQRLDSLPPHVPEAPFKINYRTVTKAQKSQWCKILGAATTQGIETCQQGQHMEATTLHAGILELQHRMPCPDITIMSPALSLILARPPDPTASAVDQENLAMTLSLVATSKLVLVPVFAHGPDHYTLLVAKKMAIDIPWEVKYRDSLPAQTATCYAAAAAIVQRLGLLPPGSVVAPSEPGLQRDGWSCGSWVLSMMDQELRHFRTELPTPPPTIGQVRSRLNEFISKLYQVLPQGPPAADTSTLALTAMVPASAGQPSPETSAGPESAVRSALEPRTFEEALERGRQCTKCRQSVREPVKGCRACMGHWFEQIRQRR
jgi:hypothetical protein